MDRKTNEAILRLFKSYLIINIEDNDSLGNKQQRSISHALLFSDYYNLDNEIIDLAIKMYGKTPEQFCSTFHKSFNTVKTATDEQLYIQQILHYITTYGFEALGIYDEASVYIPHEKLELPEITEDVKFTYIKAVTQEELTEKIMTLLSSGIALSEETLDDLKTLIAFIDKNRLDEVKNREFKIYLYDYFKMVPKDATEFLKYIVYKLTGATLLIKDRQTLQLIRESNSLVVLPYLVNYISHYGYEPLAKIYHKSNKDYFLSMKRNDKIHKDLNNIINKISNRARKLKSNKVKLDILDRVTQLEPFNANDYKLLTQSLQNCTLYRKVRLYKAINKELDYNLNSRMYRIRNGKIYIKENKKFISEKDSREDLERRKQTVYHYIISELTPKLKGKTAYIPEGVRYVLPQSEKQYFDVFPEYSCIKIPRSQSKNMVVGIKWFNLDNQRVDLDLHLVSKSTHIGWNSMYRNNNIYHSGDVTDAPKPYGATELIFISRHCKDSCYLLDVNNYMGTFDKNKKFSYEFVVAEHTDNDLSSNYPLDVNKILYQTTKTMNQENGNQQTLGLLRITDEYIKIYLTSFNMSNSRITRIDEYTKKVYDCMMYELDNQLYLDEVLQSCGCILKDKPEFETFTQIEVDERGPIYTKSIQKVDFDLSLESIEKSTFMELFK